MGYIEFFQQIFSIAFGVFAAIVLGFYIIWPKIENYLLKVNAINQSRSFTKDNLQLKFSAYERLLLLIHRIHPKEVMLRNFDGQLNVNQFKNNLINDIEVEFQHNFTQQLYVSDTSWQIVKDLKDNTVALLKNTTTPSNELEEYTTAILKHIAELDTNPYEAALKILRNEASN